MVSWSELFSAAPDGSQQNPITLVAFGGSAAHRLEWAGLALGPRGHNDDNEPQKDTTGDRP